MFTITIKNTIVLLRSFGRRRSDSVSRGVCLCVCVARGVWGGGEAGSIKQ